MKNTIAFIRVLVIFTVIFIVTESLYKSGNEPAFMSNPSVALFYILALFILITIEAVNSATNKLGLTKEEEEKLAEKDTSLSGILNRMWDSKPIEKEQDILLDHDYDGIKELDNSLPPWWLYSFYISIVFAALYLLYYEVLGGPTNVQTFDKEMAIAKAEVASYKAQNPVDLGNMASDPEAGKKIFKTTCAACHAFDGGGGIGPNLTDEYWILGGGVENIYNVISEGGRDGKGMIAWKNSLSNEKIQQVTSYVLSLQGTTPENPKEKEGELWVEK